VFEIGRLELGEKPAHAGTFNLEHADRVAPRQQLVGVGVIKLQARQIGRLLAQQFANIGNQRQVLERQEVELDEAQLLDRMHLVLSNREAVLRLLLVDIQRHIVGERPVRNYHAGGMTRRVTQQALELEGVLEQLGIFLALLAKARLHLERILERKIA